MDPRDGATMPGYLFLLFLVSLASQFTALFSASIYDMFEACGVSYNSKDEMLELIDTIAAAIQV